MFRNRFFARRNFGPIFSLILVFVLVCKSSAQKIPGTLDNHILPGFNPDPSICRSGDDYYMMTSSFEWYLGIPIYHSKDLVNWQLIGYGLSRSDQVDINETVNDSRGIYAPTIRFNKGTFYIINTRVECRGNFYITSKNPSGPWSNPIWLDDAPGINPSLFWDEDGKCYYTGNENLSETDREWIGQSFISIQELDLKQGKLIGERKKLAFGHATNARCTEGAHLYKINGKYLLMVAEGGTSFNHATTIFHSDSLLGLFIPDQVNPVFTDRHLGKDYPLWAVDHTDLVQTPHGEWWVVMHSKKRINGCSILSRETYLAQVAFENQRPVFNIGRGILQEQQQRPSLPWSPFPKKPLTDDFNGNELVLNWNFLRKPNKKWHYLKNGKLIFELQSGRIEKRKLNSLLVKRVLKHQFEATVSMEFKTKKSNEKAGLVLYRTSDSFYHLSKSRDELQLIKSTVDKMETVGKVSYQNDVVFLKIAGHKNNKATFAYRNDNIHFKQIGDTQDLSNFGDEISLRFNGLMEGVYATSLGITSKSAVKFDWFEYK